MTLVRRKEQLHQPRPSAGARHTSVQTMQNSAEERLRRTHLDRLLRRAHYRIAFTLKRTRSRPRRLSAISAFPALSPMG